MFNNRVVSLILFALNEYVPLNFEWLQTCSVVVIFRGPFEACRVLELSTSADKSQLRENLPN